MGVEAFFAFLRLAGQRLENYFPLNTYRFYIAFTLKWEEVVNRRRTLQWFALSAIGLQIYLKILGFLRGIFNTGI